jgi:addiction module RelE/StbE family toxin
MYRTEFTRSFRKDLKKLSREVQNEILDKWIPRLEEDPDIGARFVGKKLSKLRKLAFRYKRNDYRLVYQVKRKEILIIFLAAGTRENFYKRFDR